MGGRPLLGQGTGGGGERGGGGGELDATEHYVKTISQLFRLEREVKRV